MKIEKHPAMRPDNRKAGWPAGKETCAGCRFRTRAVPMLRHVTLNGLKCRTGIVMPNQWHCVMRAERCGPSSVCAEYYPKAGEPA